MGRTSRARAPQTATAERARRRPLEMTTAERPDECSRGRRPGCATETGFRHTRLSGTGPYDMNASFMSLELHERGIHVV